MLLSKSCNKETRDGVQCSAVCSGNFDYSCAGISEVGYRKLGDRKATWKCPTCKNSAAKSPVPADMDAVLTELKRLTLQVAILPTLDESVKSIKSQLYDLKALKPELT